MSFNAIISEILSPHVKCRFSCSPLWYIRPGFSALSHFSFLKANIEEKVESYDVHIHSKNTDKWISQSTLLTIKRKTNIG